ncbi:hypothetical protein [Sutcliffiella rhizosphaerae]|uniref:hypothetical protein n=1 Tax=Sutcliffiella rhizosphaerae TaxID=2880967 RepID=UPI001E2FCA7B|nr:hypothetical protein [Sutcliffiella rhizosphaerae]
MRRSICLFLVILLLTACTNSYSFSGQSDNWKMEYQVTTPGNGVESKISILYTGSDEHPEHIYYSIEGMNSKREGDATYPEKGIEWTSMECYDCMPIPKDGEIEVTIEWDGKKEVLMLTSQDD